MVEMTYMGNCTRWYVCFKNTKYCSV